MPSRLWRCWLDNSKGKNLCF